MLKVGWDGWIGIGSPGGLRYRASLGMEHLTVLIMVAVCADTADDDQDGDSEDGEHNKQHCHVLPRYVHAM